MRPITKDGVNYTMSGVVMRVLEPYEIIKADDFIRPLYESPMRSESGGWDTTFKNDNWNGCMWHKVYDDLAGWIGKSYMDYLLFVHEDTPASFNVLEDITDEIIRIIPNSSLK